MLILVNSSLTVLFRMVLYSKEVYCCFFFHSCPCSNVSKGFCWRSHFCTCLILRSILWFSDVIFSLSDRDILIGVCVRNYYMKILYVTIFGFIRWWDVLWIDWLIVVGLWHILYLNLVFVLVMLRWRQNMDLFCSSFGRMYGLGGRS